MSNEFTPESERQRLQYLVSHPCYCPKWNSHCKFCSFIILCDCSITILDHQFYNTYIMSVSLLSRASSNRSCLGTSLHILNSPDASNTRNSARKCSTETTQWLAGNYEPHIRVMNYSSSYFTKLYFDTIYIFYFIAFITITCYCFRAYKTIVEDDLKFPLIYGEGKKVSK